MIFYERMGRRCQAFFYGKIVSIGVEAFPWSQLLYVWITRHMSHIGLCGWFCKGRGAVAANRRWIWSVPIKYVLTWR